MKNSLSFRSWREKSVSFTLPPTKRIPTSVWPSRFSSLFWIASQRRVRREWKFGTINSNGGYVLGDLLLVLVHHPPAPLSPGWRAAAVHERRLEPVLSLRLNSMVTLVVLFIGCVPSLRRRATASQPLHTDVVPCTRGEGRGRSAFIRSRRNFHFSCARGNSPPFYTRWRFFFFSWNEKILEIEWKRAIEVFFKFEFVTCCLFNDWKKKKHEEYL